METQAGKLLLNSSELVLKKGRAYVFTGPSGSGKSLFLRSLFGWTSPDLPAVFQPEQGQYYLLQDPGLGLTAELTIGGHFREVGLDDPNAQELSDLLAGLHLNIPGLFQRKPAEISGGERQRIMLALILIQNPKVLVCDEPAASLDQETQQALWEYLFHQHQRTGMTLLIATHRHQGIPFAIESRFYFDQGKLVTPPKATTFDAAQEIHLMPNKTSQDNSQVTQQELEAQHITLAFGEKLLLEDAHFQLKRGRTQWLSGISGLGKTTLIHVLAGLLPNQKATLSLAGEQLDSNFSRRKHSQKQAISLLFQHGTASLNPSRSVAIQLQEAFAPYPADKTAMLASLNLDQLDLNQTPDHFSVGELQRLNLIRALSRRPAFLLADELLAPLDAINQVAVLSLLERCQKHWQMGVLICGHDLNGAAYLKGKMLVIKNLRLEVFEP